MVLKNSSSGISFVAVAHGLLTVISGLQGGMVSMGVAQNSFDESCAARITLELVCFSVAISLVFLDFQKNCSHVRSQGNILRGYLFEFY